MVEVARPELSAAEAVLRQAMSGIPPEALAAAFIEVDEDLGWLLDRPQQQLVFPPRARGV